MGKGSHLRNLASQRAQSPSGCEKLMWLPAASRTRPAPRCSGGAGRWLHWVPLWGDPVRERLTLPQSLEVLLALMSPLSASKAGLLHPCQHTCQCSKLGACQHSKGKVQS